MSKQHPKATYHTKRISTVFSLAMGRMSVIGCPWKQHWHRGMKGTLKGNTQRVAEFLYVLTSCAATTKPEWSPRCPSPPSFPTHLRPVGLQLKTHPISSVWFPLPWMEQIPVWCWSTFHLARAAVQWCGASRDAVYGWTTGPLVHFWCRSSAVRLPPSGNILKAETQHTPSADPKFFSRFRSTIERQSTSGVPWLPTHTHTCARAHTHTQNERCPC